MAHLEQLCQWLTAFFSFLFLNEQSKRSKKQQQQKQSDAQSCSQPIWVLPTRKGAGEGIAAVRSLLTAAVLSHSPIAHGYFEQTQAFLSGQPLSGVFFLFVKKKGNKNHCLLITIILSYSSLAPSQVWYLVLGKMWYPGPFIHPLTLTFITVWYLQPFFMVSSLVWR